jgi:MFS family permease
VSDRATTAPPRPLPLGVIFLTLYIDLIGFSIIFPLVPDILAYYLAAEGQDGWLGMVLAGTGRLAGWFGKDEHFAAVLIGGVLTSIYALLQFVFAPFWGGMSDRRGRRPVLMFTVAGTAASYLLWVVSGSFALFIVARIASGLFSGNLSVVTAAVADVTSRQERSKAMGLVGAAFGLGLVTGPLVGAFTASINLLDTFPAAARWGLNPFSVPALVSFGLCLFNLVWIRARFEETLPANERGEAPARLQNPLRAVMQLESPAVRRINLVAFTFALAFCAMEFSLTFLGAERFGYTARQNGLAIGFLGFCSILTQGLIVRRLLPRWGEIKVLRLGLVSAALGLLLIGLAPTPGWLYAGLAVLAIGAGLFNPSSSGLISLYSDRREQGRVLGLFRSLGSLARAVTPVLAGVAFWLWGGGFVFVTAAALAGLALVLALPLPRPGQ